MELHHSLRALVDDHGSGVLADADGFRGVLDDVLTEDQATTGDINLLVDAVRFDAVAPLGAMIDGGADPALAVEEAGQRLARSRGGADTQSASWAAAVLGYAVGKVPEAVVQRLGAQRAQGGTYARPPAGAPPAGAPAAAPPSSPYQSPSPTIWPPASAAAGAGSVPQHSHALPHGYPVAGAVGGGAGTPHKPGRSPWVWVAAAVAAVVVVGGGIGGIVAATGGDGPPKGSDDPSEPATPKVDVEPEAINDRYSALATDVTAGASECAAAEPGAGENEVVECAVNAGTLRLVTYADASAQDAARTARLDYRAGTLSSSSGTMAYYEFDPERAGTSDPPLVYWDSTSSLQSAQITGSGSAKIDTIATLYEATSPRVAVPSTPTHPVLREFININMEVSGCSRQRTFFIGETEESRCESGNDDVAVNVGRYADAQALRKDRKYYKAQYAKATTKGGGGVWQLDGENAGAYYAYSDGGSATLYWDWNKSTCNCYGVAWNFDGDLSKLENWWPSDE